MSVCSIVKLLSLGTVDDPMHYCTRPSAPRNSASGRPRHLGVIVLTILQTCMKSLYTYLILMTKPCYFCVACEAWSTQRDHYSVGVAVIGVVLASHFLFSINNFWRNAPTYLPTYLHVPTSSSLSTLVASGINRCKQFGRSKRRAWSRSKLFDTQVVPERIFEKNSFEKGMNRRRKACKLPSRWRVKATIKNRDICRRLGVESNIMWSRTQFE